MFLGEFEEDKWLKDQKRYAVNQEAYLAKLKHAQTPGK